jgi:hypothetical protein
MEKRDLEGNILILCKYMSQMGEERPTQIKHPQMCHIEAHRCVTIAFCCIISY